MTQSSWQDLRDRFLQACSEQDAEPSQQWLEMWHLLLTHPWYREQLTSAAKTALRNRRYPVDWQGDIEHEAIVLLARRLRKRPCLGIDPCRAKQHFAGWMRTIITHDCRDALRRLCRHSNSTFPLLDCLPASDERAARETRIDLAIALGQLDELERAVTILYSKGFTIRQAAETLDVTFWRAYRAYHGGLGKLRRLL